MKVHKITLTVIDFDQLGAEEVKNVLENARYPNHCINPQILSVETKDIGEWDDSNPLNNRAKHADAIRKLFG